MPNRHTKKFSIQEQRAHIVARMMVKCLSSVRPEDYGTRSISTAMERVMVMFDVRKCEADGLPCTASRIAKDLKMPRSSVIRMLDELSALKIITRVERHYIPTPEEGHARLSPSQLSIIVHAVILAGRDLAALHGADVAPRNRAHLA